MKQAQDNQITDFISVAEASQLSGYNPDYLSSLCRSRKLAGMKLGRNWVVSRTSLEQFMTPQAPEVVYEPHVRLVPETENESGTESDNRAVQDVMRSAVELQLTALKERMKARVALEQVSALESSVRSVERAVLALTETKRSVDVQSDEVVQQDAPAVESLTVSPFAFLRGLRWLGVGVLALTFFAVVVSAYGIPTGDVAVVVTPMVEHSHEQPSSTDAGRVAVVVTQKKVLAQSYSQGLVPNFSLRDLDQLILSNINQIVAAGWLQNSVSHPTTSAQQGVTQNNPNAALTGGQTFAPIFYYPPVSASPSTGGSIFSATDLSSQFFTTNTAKVTDTATIQVLKVNGATALGGGLVVGGSITATSGLINPGFATGSIPFQGVSGLKEDNAYFFYDETNHRLGLGTTTPTALLTVGSTHPFTVQENGDVSVGGNLDISGSATTLGQLVSARVPTLPHTFSPWPSGTSNADDATIYLNPPAAGTDTNLIAAAVGGAVKFLVDAEGDIYGKNLILTGSTSSGSTVVAGDLTVQDNSTLGDASTDTLRVSGKMSINLTAPAALQGDLDIRQIQNGDTLLYARRYTDTIPTGNFITYQSAAGANLFSVDTSGAALSTASFTAPLINATSAIQLNGVNINTAGALSNVAYLDQANVFTNAQIINTASATAFAVGPNGATNPALKVVANITAAATGLSITGNAAGGGVSLDVLSSGANENLNINPKGTGNVVVSSGSRIQWGTDTTAQLYRLGSGVLLTPATFFGANVIASTNGYVGQDQAGTYTFYISPTTGQKLGAAQPLTWTAVNDARFGAVDLTLRRAAAANLALGAVDAASPVAQTLSVQNVVSGTTNTAGADFTRLVP